MKSIFLFALLLCTRWTNRSGVGYASSPGSSGSVGVLNFARPRRRGVGRELAAKTAGSPHGPWRLSNSPALNIALPNAFFASLGLATLVPKRVA